MGDLRLELTIQDPYQSAYAAVISTLESAVRKRELAGIEDALKECGYLKERTCEPVDVYGVGVLDCGECGAQIANSDEPIPNYCHNCGAKVIGSSKYEQGASSAEVVE